MVKDNNFIVDKTPWISEALTGPKLKLITRPRRFGKTTNLSMLEAFLTKDEKLEAMDLFAGFSIQNDTKFEKIRKEHQHRYAVLQFTFLNCRHASTALEFEKNFLEFMKLYLNRKRDQYRRFFGQEEKQYLQDIVFGNGGLSQVLTGYDMLIRKLQANGFKIAVLIDEYDAPFQGTIEQAISETAAGKSFVVGELYARTVILIRDFYMFFFRGMQMPIDYGIMIGISFMAKNSIFSDLSDFMAYTGLHDDKFGPYFGFLDHEVKWLIDSTGTNLSYAEFKEWYDGYHFGHCVIFNPYAVVSAFHRGQFSDYWAESGSLEVIRHLMKYTGRYGMLDLHFLLSGQSLRKEIHEYLRFTDLIKTEESYWTLLTFAGYVDGTKLNMESEGNRTYSLRIPNKELSKYLTRIFKIELEEAKKMYDGFVYSFNHLNNNASDFEKFLFDRFNTRSPYHMLPKKAGLETLVNVFESLFVGFEFNYRSLRTLNMNETPVCQIFYIKIDTAHVFNIAKMDAISSHNASHDIDQLLNLPLIEDNLSVMKKLRISRFLKTGIKIIVEAGKDIGLEIYAIAIKTMTGEAMQLIKDVLFPHHG